MTVLPITREGGLLAKLRAMFGNEAQIQEGDVRLEKVLQANDVAERFNMNGDGQARRPLEVFIGLNDLVVPDALKVAVNKQLLIAGNNGNAQDITYPDLGVFNVAATATAVSESDALNAIWSGNISIKANTIEILNTEQLRRFKIIPQTQSTATTLPMTDEESFVPIIQPAIFSGRDTNILEFQPAPGADLQQIAGDPATELNILVFHYKVLVVRNGAQPATWTQVSEILEKYTQNRVIL